MDNGQLKLTVGGIPRNLRVEIGLAPKLENATGLGIVALARQLQDFSATTATVAAVLREALSYAGATYSQDEAFRFVEHDGLLKSYSNAGVIVAALFGGPERKSAGKKSPAASGQTTGGSL